MAVGVTSVEETEASRRRLHGAGSSGFDLPAPERYEGEYRHRRQRSGLALYEALGIARDDMAARAAQGRRNFEVSSELPRGGPGAGATR